MVSNRNKKTATLKHDLRNTCKTFELTQKLLETKTDAYGIAWLTLRVKRLTTEIETIKTELAKRG